MVGEAVDYVVTTGETFETIAKRLGAEPLAIARRNTRWVHAPLAAGTKLTVDAHRIVPAGVDRGLIVSVAQNRVFLLDGGNSTLVMPADFGCSPRPTPSGAFHVVVKDIKPPQNATSSIQEEMRRLGNPLATDVARWPNNPRGDFWIGLSLGNIGIHGTHDPPSNPGSTSHGCITLRPPDIKLLFERVEIGAAGMIVREPVLLTHQGGRIFAEVHQDLSGHRPDILRALMAAADRLGVRALVDWSSVQRLVQLREGLAIDVTIK
jgi:lipoprotein-anchoring transpeptidase ErfK/SrfK